VTEIAPDAIILVGGEGTRLRSVVPETPKPLAPVAGRPFLEWLLRALHRQGVARVVLSTGVWAEQIEAFVDRIRSARELDLDLECVRDPQPLGTGGALRNALAEVRTDRVLALNGDSYCAFDLRDLVHRHLERRARASLVLTRVTDTARFGSVTLDAGHRITDFREKSRSAGPGLVNAGVYLLEREALEEIPSGRNLSLERDVLPGWVGAALFGVVSEGSFIDIGTPESYARSHTFVDWPALANTADGSRPTP
jgi:NDP-sugar pyrophosphorylase family protein